MELNDYIDRRARNWDAMTKILDDAKDAKRELTAEETQTYERLETDVDSDTRAIERLQKHAERAREFDKVETDPIVVPGSEDGQRGEEGAKAYASAFTSFIRGGMADLEPEHRKVLRAGFVDGKELRAQGVATNAAGGYLVPQGFRQNLIETMKFYGAVRSVATVIETDTGATLPWPTNDDTANKGAILAENTQVTEQDVTIGQAQLGAYMYTSKLVRVSFQLLQDSAFDLPAFLARKLGERLGRITNEHYTTGTGTSQPEGVQTNATIGKTGATGQTTTVTGDDLIDLIHSVDPAYRNERSRFMLHDLSLAKVRKLKDANNMYLWQPSVQAGVADTLLGYGYTVNNDMPQMAANAKSVLFGDFQAAFVIRDVLGIQLLRLEERYADFLQVGFLSFLRTDSEPQDAAAIRAYRNSAT